MYKKTLLSALISASIAAGTAFSLVYADEVDEVEQADVEVTDDGRKFDSTERLEETLIGWQEEKVADAEQDVKDARDLAVENFEEEKNKLTEQIAELSEEQLFALNRSLNNATNNGLIVDLNSEYMQDLLDGNYNKQQINSLTKALEEEAKFDKLSDKFTSKYDLTGNEKFSDKADMMTAKGERQKDKFLAKVDKFDRNDLDVEHQNKARKAARDSAKSTARDASKNSARKDAKRAAKNSAKKVAKENARNKEKSNNGKKKT
ncbi:MAG: hypothetical protein KZQ70_05255 [gamma proteobacterium symbiont of Lucinoma myriamae]|nr:hypothetical protein [gamma proteobacterium symbiont of Lucinoma myriamae]MCU7831968.1 hypothetical protein [gamma proteobacterium symbiont of Lucinoma myriamae]